MIAKSWLYDAILYIYALSLLFYFSDVARRNRNAKRLGTGFLSFVWVLQTVFFVQFLFYHVHEWYSTFVTLFFFSWLLVTVTLFIQRFFRIDLIVFFVNVFGFAVFALNIFSNPDIVPSIRGWGINDELLFIHISLAIASYAAFLVAAVFSGMYLFLHRKLKEKQWNSTMKRLPSLEIIDRYTFISIWIGTPLLIMSLALGIVWIVLQHDIRLLLDPKVLNSLVVLAGYGYYLLQRLSLRSPGYKLAMWNLAAFGIVLCNFIVSNLISGFHHWVWK